ncbi:lipopolysaccharide biosynthesis protein [Microbacterium protaetiae]|uniref:Lipopolysaccharide biosynthesis protein n=1 Tax=Microbacterium protaetiae TaxID=2509458 RepID=A0A4V0YD99_9MICO|nr:lipopolysaccharide biosynthesis protein [Microbacterium protaetiae]QAY59971.1 lipopolysaccharide biosynthesis protein [Microbacterium protaetiae]
MAGGGGADGRVNEHGQLADKAITSVMWSAAQRWVVRIAGFVTILILTRLLSPQDFGTVAIATSMLPIVNVLADMGFSSYIMQASHVDRRMLSTAFWFTTAAGVVLAGGLFLSAPVIALIFNISDVSGVVRGLVPAVLLVTASTVPMSLLRRRMRFRALAAQSICAALVGQAAAVALALMGFGVWALIAQTVLNQLVTFVFCWFSARWIPRLSFSLAEFKAMSTFGIKVVSVEIVGVGRSLAENAIIVAALGPAGLGYLNIAQRLIQVVQDVSAAAIVPVSTVVFAQVRGEADRLRSAYSRSLSMGYGVIIPVMIVIALVSPIILPAFFGQVWVPSVAASQVLAVASIFVTGALIDYGLLYGVGKPGMWLIYATAIDGLTILSAALTARFGLVSWALGFLVVAIVATIVRWALVAHVLAVRWQSVASPFFRAMATAAVSGALGYAAYVLSQPLGPVACVVLTGTAVLLAQFGAMFVIMRATFREVVRLVSQRLPIVSKSTTNWTQRLSRTVSVRERAASSDSVEKDM